MSNSEFARQKLAELNTENCQSLINKFDDACNQYADKIAFSCIGQELTFAEIDSHSSNFATYLLTEAGLDKGDRVAIQLPNLIQYPIVAWGILRANLTIVNTNPMYTERELIHQFNDSGAKALVVLADLLPLVEKVLPQTGISHVVVTNVFDMIEAQPLPKSDLDCLTSLPDALAKGASVELPPSTTTMDSIAVLQYTGGTTGVAKGAVLSQGNLFASAAQSAKASEEMLTPQEIAQGVEEIVIAPMPMYHVYGFTLSVITVFLTGGLSVLIPDPRNIDSLIEAMKAYRFTGMAGVNTLFVGMMAHPDFDQVDYSNVKGVIAGGAALVKEIGEEWKARTGSDIFEGYGLSETAATLTVNKPNKRKLGTVGTPMANMEVQLRSAAGIEVGVDEEGEICVRGPQVMEGYWQRAAATAEVLDKEGWFKTGDIAILQHDGFIKIVDRLTDMILVSGFNVYPNEIEDVVYSHKDIFECAVVGVKDAKSGEAVKLYLASTNPDLSVDDIKAYCRERLTGYKIPKFIEFKPELPKSNVGKILRRELRDEANA
jgi:long-chain acyl-CoA synthetase